jgi:hypothetical protein
VPESCAFAVRVAAPEVRLEIERRLARLADYYSPLGEPRCRLERAGPRLLWGCLEFGDAEAPRDPVIVWGERPWGVATAEQLVAADDAALRQALDRSLALIAAMPERMRLVTGAAPPTTLYEASSGQATAWSTHAVAAAFLAHGQVSIDRAAVPELLATELVGAGRCLVEGAIALPAACVVDVTAAAVERRSYWPPAERWASAPDDSAGEAASLLIEQLQARVSGFRRPQLGLTGGLDSRVVAVALREAGLEFEAFTWGSETFDVEEARRVAAALGLRHRALPYKVWADAEALEHVDEITRWHEGAMPVGFGRPTMPAEMDAQITGMGGETGRCFYYANATHLYREPSAEQASALLAGLFLPRLAGARPEARARLRAALDCWVAEAQASGAAGWRLLDVVYLEQRVQRWGRAMWARQSAPQVGAFCSAALAGRLAGQPLADRLAADIARSVIAAHAPELSPPPGQRPRAYRSLPALRARLRRRMSRSAQLPATGQSVNVALWEQRPQFRSWIADEVLGSELLATTVGVEWAAAVHERFLAGDAEAERLAVQAAGPVSLAASFAELRA